MSTPQPQVTMPNTELWMLSSSHVSQEFSIAIGLPDTYSESDEAYPVLYVLDGNTLFGIVTETIHLLDFLNELHKMIVVGIGYPGISTFKSTMGFRTRDFTPTENSWYETEYKSFVPDAPEYVGEGGAAQFLQFIGEELMPLINTKYRTISDDNSLMGFSFSGLFALYTLFSQPGMFKRYLICSPSVWWHDDTILSLEKNFAENNSDLAAWVFMSVGGKEPEMMIADMYSISHTLQSRQYESLKMTTHFFEGEGHMSVVPAFISRSLRAAFAPGE